MTETWIDIHCHLDRLEGGAKFAVDLAQENGVGRMITIGTEPEDLPIVLDLASQFPNQVYCTLGIHPHEGVKYSKSVADFIILNSSQPSVVAVGEIGLDYYYNQSPKKEQLEAFNEQLEIAAPFFCDMPVISSTDTPLPSRCPAIPSSAPMVITPVPPMPVMRML